MGEGGDYKIITQRDFTESVLLTEKCYPLFSISKNSGHCTLHSKTEVNKFEDVWQRCIPDDFLLGNSYIGGIMFPVVFTAIATITSVLFSVDVNKSTCFTHFLPIVLSDL